MTNISVGLNVLTIYVSFSVNDAIPHNVISDTYVINHVDSFLLHIPASGQEAAKMHSHCHDGAHWACGGGQVDRGDGTWVDCPCTCHIGDELSERCEYREDSHVDDV